MQATPSVVVITNRLATDRAAHDSKTTEKQTEEVCEVHLTLSGTSSQKAQRTVLVAQSRTAIPALDPLHPTMNRAILHPADDETLHLHAPNLAHLKHLRTMIMMIQICLSVNDGHELRTTTRTVGTTDLGAMSMTRGLGEGMRTMSVPADGIMMIDTTTDRVGEIPTKSGTMTGLVDEKTTTKTDLAATGTGTLATTTDFSGTCEMIE
ncbi:hypothetical protein SLS60_009080 [Paraconiothyrium brasiliense]|uniref:Uncharacterized protein n=1 Tax=Paraconiothyrium brasiliense TaxID=300254 RepID=A0ABR3QW89_9PLEO